MADVVLYWSGVLIYIRGMFFGGLMTIIIQGILLYMVYLQIFKKSRKKINSDPTTSETTDSAKNPTSSSTNENLSTSSLPEVPHKHKEPWPPEILHFLNDAMAVHPKDIQSEKGLTTSVTESCQWLNIVAHRYFLELRSSELFKYKTKKKISENINLRLKGNSFVSKVELTDIDLGMHPLKIHGARMIKEVSDDLAITCELDVTYVGGANITLEATLSGGIQLAVKVFLTGLSGKLRIRCPSIKWSDMLCVSFAEDPGAQFVVDSPITLRENQMVKDLVNKLLAKVVRKAFMETWVNPNWRSFYLPLMQPYPEQILARVNQKPCPGLPFDFRSANDDTHINSMKGSPSRGISRGISVLDSMPLSSKTLALDPLSDTCFSPLIVLHEKDLSTHKTSLVNAVIDFLGFSTSSSDSSPSLKPSKQLDWRTLKNRNGVNFQKARTNTTTGQIAELQRADFEIECEAEQVYSFLSNPRHLSQVDENYMGFNILDQIDATQCIIHGAYQVARNSKVHYLVYQIKHQLEDGNYVVAGRSIQGYEPASTSQDSPDTKSKKLLSKYSHLPTREAIFLFAYFIKREGSKSIITACSSMPPTFAKLQVSFQHGRNIKDILEEVKALSEKRTKSNEAPGEDVADDAVSIYASMRRRQAGAQSSSGNGARNMDKIKSVISSTTSYLMKGKPGTASSWLGNKLSSLQGGGIQQQNHQQQQQKDEKEDHAEEDNSDDSDNVDIDYNNGSLNLSDSQTSLGSFKNLEFVGADDTSSVSLLEESPKEKPSNHELDSSKGTLENSPETPEVKLVQNEKRKAGVENEIAIGREEEHQFQKYSVSEADLLVKEEKVVEAVTVDPFELSSEMGTDAIKTEPTQSSQSTSQAMPSSYSMSFHEQLLMGREPFQVSHVHDKEFPRLKLSWEFSVRKEAPLLFSILFIPEEGQQMPISLLKISNENQYIILERTSVNCYLQPCLGEIILDSSFPTGKFMINFDPSLSKSDNILLYHTSLASVDLDSCKKTTLSIDMNIGRKSFVSVPVFHMVPDSSSVETVFLEYEYMTFGQDVGFAVDFQSIDRSPLPGRHRTLSAGPTFLSTASLDDKSLLPTSSTSKSGATPISVSGPGTAISSPTSKSILSSSPLSSRIASWAQQQREGIILPMNRVTSSKTCPLIGRIPSIGKSGIYYFLWDNSHSLLSHRRVKVKLDLYYG